MENFGMHEVLQLHIENNLLTNCNDKIVGRLQDT